MADDDTGPDDSKSDGGLGDQIEGVLKGLKDMAVPHRKVDEIDKAVADNRRDRAARRAIGG